MFFFTAFRDEDNKKKKKKSHRRVPLRRNARDRKVSQLSRCGRSVGAVTLPINLLVPLALGGGVGGGGTGSFVTNLQRAIR